SANLTALNLASLSPGNYEQPPRAAEALANSAHLGNLAELDFRESRIGDEGLTALVRSPGLRQLTSLGLAHADIGPAAARALALAESPHLNKLRALSVYGNSLRRTAREAIRKRWRFAWT